MLTTNRGILIELQVLHSYWNGKSIWFLDHIDGATWQSESILKFVQFDFVRFKLNYKIKTWSKMNDDIYYDIDNDNNKNN